MILSQKNIRYLLLGICFLYALLYVYILKSKAINIENLVMIKYVAITVFIVSLGASIFLIKRDINKAWLFYEVMGIALILFFLTSVFVLNVEDIFFWDSRKNLNKQFFTFSFSIYGWNYILAIPYLILLICESSFFYNRSRNKKL
jgi:hypothetical protein